jgi:hypothetical protein
VKSEGEISFFLTIVLGYDIFICIWPSVFIFQIT